MNQTSIRVSLYYRTKQLMLQVTWRGWALHVERTIAFYSPSYLIRLSRVRLNLAHGPRHHHFQQPLYRQSDLADFWGADRTQAGRKRLSALPPRCGGARTSHKSHRLHNGVITCVTAEDMTGKTVKHRRKETLGSLLSAGLDFKNQLKTLIEAFRPSENEMPG